MAGSISNHGPYFSYAARARIGEAPAARIGRAGLSATAPREALRDRPLGSDRPSIPDGQRPHTRDRPRNRSNRTLTNGHPGRRASPRRKTDSGLSAFPEDQGRAEGGSRILAGTHGEPRTRNPPGPEGRGWSTTPPSCRPKPLGRRTHQKGGRWAGGRVQSSANARLGRDVQTAAKA